jgi:hypothetical protein
MPKKMADDRVLKLFPHGSRVNRLISSESTSKALSNFAGFVTIEKVAQLRNTEGRGIWTIDTWVEPV